MMLLCYASSQGDAVDNTGEEQQANNTQVKEGLYAVRIYCTYMLPVITIVNIVPFTLVQIFSVWEYPKNPDSFHMIGSVGKRRKDILWKSAQSFVCVECG